MADGSAPSLESAFSKHEPENFSGSPSFDEIDWSRPWLAPFLEIDAILHCAPGSWLVTANRVARKSALTNHQGLPLRFVDQCTLPDGEAYEAFISRTGGVPTRDNLHDFFNTLVWLNYPASKRQLNAIQAAELARHAMVTGAPGVAGATRGKLRDRATIFDENAAILLSSAPAIERALREHDWQECLIMNRAAFGTTCELRLFGHALLEKLVKPYKAITAHVWVIQVEANYFMLGNDARRAFVDHALASRLEQGLLEAPPTPLPVLGVPGWAPAQDATFYADSSVFRAKKIGACINPEGN